MTEGYPEKDTNEPSYEEDVSLDAAYLFQEFDDFFTAVTPPPLMIDLDYPPVSQDRPVTIEGEFLTLLAEAYDIDAPLRIEVVRGTDKIRAILMLSSVLLLALSTTKK